MAKDQSPTELYTLGWIKLHRSMLLWEWYSDINCFRLFIHCILKANHQDNKWRGEIIKRGQFVTSFQKVHEHTGLSIQAIRTALTKLKSTKELTSESTGLFTIITVCNYEDYQDEKKSINIDINKPINAISTSSQHDSNTVVTTTEEYKEVKKERSNRDFQKPDAFSIASEFPESTSITVGAFLDYYTSNGWKVGKNPMKDWKAAFRRWMNNDKKFNPIIQKPKMQY